MEKSVYSNTVCVTLTPVDKL